MAWWSLVAGRGNLVKVVALIPLIIIALLSFPAWVGWPFLPQPRRDSVLAMVEQLAKWAHQVLDTASKRSGDDEGIETRK